MLKPLLIKVYRTCRRWSYVRKQSSQTPFSVTSSGHTFLMYPEGQISEALYVGRFERRERESVASILKPGMTVVDFGANVGLYTLLAAKCVAPNGKVWAFEPSSETYDRLQKNIALNLESHIEPIKMAVSDTHGGTLTLRRQPGTPDGMRYLATDDAAPILGAGIIAPDGADDPGDDESVPITTLDQFVLDHGITQVDFIKVDVEGHELAAFRGAEKTLLSNERIVLMVECTENALETFTYLRGLGFGLYSRDRAKSDWVTDDETMMRNYIVWACRDRSLLPVLK